MCLRRSINCPAILPNLTLFPTYSPLHPLTFPVLNPVNPEMHFIVALSSSYAAHTVLCSHPYLPVALCYVTTPTSLLPPHPCCSPHILAAPTYRHPCSRSCPQGVTGRQRL